MKMEVLHPFYPENCKNASCIIPGIYAMVGAASVTAGVTRLSISLTVIMFELTGAFTHILPLIMAIMVARWVGDAFGKDGIFDECILDAGYPYLNHKRTLLRNPATAGDMMLPSILLFREEEYSVRDLQCKLYQLENNFPALDGNNFELNLGGFPLVDENGMLVGYISQSDLIYCCKNRTFSINFRDDNNGNSISKWVDYAPLSGIKAGNNISNSEHFRRQCSRAILKAWNSNTTCCQIWSIYWHNS